MSAITAACCLIDALVDSGSFLRTQVSACDFGIMNNAPACAVIVRPSVSNFSYDYGYNGRRTWGWNVLGWIQGTADPEDILRRIITMHDSLYGALTGGSIANCASLTTRVRSISHDWTTITQISGRDYWLVQAAVTAEES